VIDTRPPLIGEAQAVGQMHAGSPRSLRDDDGSGASELRPGQARWRASHRASRGRPPHRTRIDHCRAVSPAHRLQHAARVCQRHAWFGTAAPVAEPASSRHQTWESEPQRRVVSSPTEPYVSAMIASRAVSWRVDRSAARRTARQIAEIRTEISAHGMLRTKPDTRAARTRTGMTAIDEPSTTLTATVTACWYSRTRRAQDIGSPMLISRPR
jgi:hypothetical protein